LQTGNDTIDATAQDLGDSASDSQAATA